MIDAHLHLWDRSRGGYAWITPELGPLYRDFGPDEAAAELRAAGVDAAILVQADDSAARHRASCSTSRAATTGSRASWAGCRSTTRGAAAAALDELDAEPLLRGIRHLVHDDPRDEFLDLPAVRTSLAAVAAHGLVFDVPDAWPRHLAGAGRVARAVPELTVVIDHLAKPPVGTDEFEAWEAELRARGGAAEHDGEVLRPAPAGHVVRRRHGRSAARHRASTRSAPTASCTAATGRCRCRTAGTRRRGASCATASTASPADERDAILGGNAERCYLDEEVRPMKTKSNRRCPISDHETA